jgi:hypothetical protein
MSDSEKLDPYEMVKFKNKLELFWTYLYNLNLATFQPTCIPK